MMSRADSRWDDTYKEGELAELFVRLLFTGKVKSAQIPTLTVEVKSDLQYANTTRFYVETSCRRQKTNGWAPSGIFDPDLAAHILVYNLSGILLIAPVEAWQYTVAEHGEERAGGDEANPAIGKLLTPIEWYRGFREWANINPELWKQYIPEEYTSGN